MRINEPQRRKKVYNVNVDQLFFVMKENNNYTSHNAYKRDNFDMYAVVKNTKGSYDILYNNIIVPFNYESSHIRNTKRFMFITFKTSDVKLTDINSKCTKLIYSIKWDDINKKHILICYLMSVNGHVMVSEHDVEYD